MNIPDLIADILKSKKFLKDNDQRADRAAATFQTTYREQLQVKEKIENLKHKMIEGDNVYQEWKDLIYELLTKAKILILMEKLRDEIAAETSIQEELLKKKQQALETTLADELNNIVVAFNLDKVS